MKRFQRPLLYGERWQILFGVCILAVLLVIWMVS